MGFTAFDDLVKKRFETLIKNIKAASNSFYDSYLDLLECTIKYILDKNNIPYNSSRTCGEIIKDSNVIDFFTNTLLIDKHTINKLPDYIKKCNDHKHKKEKLLGIDSIINYLKVYYDFVNYYFKYINELEFVFNKDYFISIFGETERLNKEYKSEIEELRKKLEEAYQTNKLSENSYNECKELLTLEKIEKYALDEQNQLLKAHIGILSNTIKSEELSNRVKEIERLNREILLSIRNKEKEAKNNGFIDELKRKELEKEVDDFFRMSIKKYIFVGLKSINYYKLLIFLLGISIITCSVILSYNMFVNLEIFPLFGAIVIIQTFLLTIKTLFRKKKELDINLAYGSNYKFTRSRYFYINTFEEKKSFKVIRILAIIEEFVFLVGECNKINIPMIILYIVIIVLYIFFLIVNRNFMKDFSILIEIYGLNHERKYIKMYYLTFENNFYSEEEFSEKFKSLKNRI